MLMWSVMWFMGGSLNDREMISSHDPGRKRKVKSEYHGSETQRYLDFQNILNSFSYQDSSLKFHSFSHSQTRTRYLVIGRNAPQGVGHEPQP